MNKHGLNVSAVRGDIYIYIYKHTCVRFIGALMNLYMCFIAFRKLMCAGVGCSKEENFIRAYDETRILTLPYVQINYTVTNSLYPKEYILVLIGKNILYSPVVNSKF